MRSITDSPIRSAHSISKSIAITAEPLEIPIEYRRRRFGHARADGKPFASVRFEPWLND
jgi:hypothetical protein